MTDRENLIKLIDDAYYHYRHGEGDSCLQINFAYYLDANGVVVREKGEWVWDKKFGDYKCSICGGYDITVPAFCRTCGADMRGVNDD